MGRVIVSQGDGRGTIELCTPTRRFGVDVIALSLGAAFLYALTSVLQHQSTSTLKPDRSLRLSLLLGLLRQPRWLASIVVDIGAYVLQFLALRVGSVVVVQTLLVSGLLFALPLGAIAMRMRPQLHDWAATAAVVLGLGLFLGSANPSVGAEGATPRAWVTTLVVLASVVVALLACGRGRSQTHRAAALGAAGGVLYGLTAALAKASGQVLDGGVIHVLRSWEPYALGAVALAGLLVAQSAFHAGPLQASLPLLTAADPVTAGVIGVACFHEHLSDEPAHLAAYVAALMLMTVGTYALTRSPLVLATHVEGVSRTRQSWLS